MGSLTARQGWWVPSHGQANQGVGTQNGEPSRNGVGCFILGHKQTLNRWNLLKVIVGTLDDMEQRFADTPRPFIFTIDSASRFNRYM